MNKKDDNMNFLYKLEKKFGKYAISNLSTYIVGSWAIGILLWLFAPKMYELLIFDVAYVFAGHQYWRIITWVFTMPGTVGVFSVLMLFVYHSIGNSIENHVGTFLYNIFIFGAYFFVTLGMLVDGAIWYLNSPSYFADKLVGLKEVGYGQDVLECMAYVWPIDGAGPTYFLSISVFLGFALIYIDSTMLFMFVFPVKTKWLAYADLAILAYFFIRYGEYTPLLRGIILGVVINFYLFYLISKNYSSRRMRNWQRSSGTIKRQREFKKKMEQAQMEYNSPQVATRHKCAVCGRTEADDDSLEFRYCSRCNGNYEYCNEHLFTHEHVK